MAAQLELKARIEEFPSMMEEAKVQAQEEIQLENARLQKDYQNAVSRLQSLEKENEVRQLAHVAFKLSCSCCFSITSRGVRICTLIRVLFW